MIAKICHRDNPGGSEEDYENIVMRMGWSYSTSASDTQTYEIDFGIEYDEEPLVLISVGMTHWTDILPPEYLWQFISTITEYTWYNQIITKTGVTVTLKKDIAFDRFLEHGLVWLAIGKKT